jgi:hypothetical protein
MTGTTTVPETDRIELRIALDLAKRAAVVAPVLVLAMGLWRGPDAAGAVVLALAVVVGNWVLAAWSLGWAARNSPGLLMGVALFGFIARLALITAIGVGIKELDIVDWPVFCGTLLAAYAGLLIWELRYVSFSLAHPGLKPKAPVPTTDEEKAEVTG